jgi:moderate conductance mechanosensitive channel
VITTPLDPTDLRALGGHVEATLIALIVAIVVWRGSIVLIDRSYKRRFVSTHMPRVATFVTLSRSVIGLVVIVALTLTLLNIWSVDVTPAVWSAGFITAALAFGSQNLVRDIVTGFFFLFEDQYDVGDRVELVTSGGQIVKGRVDAMGLRTTRVVDRSGRFVIIPNGNIALVTNGSRLPTTASFTLTMPWKGDAAEMRARIESHAKKIAEQAGIAGADVSVVLAESTHELVTFRIDLRAVDADDDLDRSNFRVLLAGRLQSEGWLPGAPEKGAG